MQQRLMMHAPRLTRLNFWASQKNYLTKVTTRFHFCSECLSGSQNSSDHEKKLVKMLALRFYLYILSSICLETAHSHKLSPVENELRDLVTQTSVIRCGGMASVIRGFRDGTIATVEWPSLIEAELELERASKNSCGISTWSNGSIYRLVRVNTYFAPNSMLICEKATLRARLGEHFSWRRTTSILLATLCSLG